MGERFKPLDGSHTVLGHEHLSTRRTKGKKTYNMIHEWKYTFSLCGAVEVGLLPPHLVTFEVSQKYDEIISGFCLPASYVAKNQQHLDLGATK